MFGWKAIASRLEAIATRVEAIAIRLEVIELFLIPFRIEEDLQVVAFCPPTAHRVAVCLPWLNTTYIQRFCWKAWNQS